MVETVEICQVMWIVMLVSTKDRILGVDTPEQHGLPRIHYGMICLITGVVGSVPCSNE
jgi:hypothetical protein